MTQQYHQLNQDIGGNLASLRSGIPQVMEGFGAMVKAANVEGTLDSKTKELIALVLGVAMRCDPCTGFHTKALVDLGVTEAEIQEMLGVAIYMGGGPSMMHAANAMTAFNEFSEAKAVNS
ncbi:carboxymuconolactone decarboxylase family protein [Paenalcaligenes hominis]|uniref:carboxymuconolactone decarboxylase family protein n=1 Tax=Paenalcaligenes hominis TaxID=643674 RepID=UPI00352414DB